MTKIIWITRTQPSADDSARLWEAAGFKAIAAPLLRVVNAPERPAAPESDAVLVFTSKNGVFAFQGHGFKPQNKVITVGDATAAAARAAGFRDVASAKGVSADAAALCLKHVPKTTPIIHCAGRHVRGSIVEDLTASGYDARRDLYYQSEPVTAWPDIDYAAISHIAFYSPLAAKTFAALLHGKPSGRLSLDIHIPSLISISRATDATLEGVIDAKRVVAREPNEAAMLAVLKDLA